ncbi:MAG: tRNA (adenosine(37)-N6)-threonylcarbamoyltransferase complex ATPase subunit type 1 TsaE [Clostridia bacterium]|nr:tRNA (adenosine(37)-N6)-threonylcarbamoyltransferase complex ATPase subunit type 1 TsaE [Clostridia bacterium]MDD4375435.1 tRNA (adenosine(37)-N6)-threonylcarbamoyltransferase complex ATPase subunit type 1 TsaE [Clostridia bacterium]
MKQYTTKNEYETEQLAKKIAKDLNNNSIVVLNGNLGVGKTRFTLGVAKYFGVENLVSSPTFTIVNEYNVKDHNFVNNIFHFDVYRLNNSDDFIDSIGTDYFGKGICIIEWGNIIKDILPSETIYINIENPLDAQDENIRKITIYKEGDLFNE